MTDNEKLARWQGWEEYHSDINKHVPDYLNDDDAAMSLLDTLVEKGFATRVEYDYEQDQWAAVIFKPVAMGANCILHRWKPNRREAIIAACLEVARKELEGCAMEYEEILDAQKQREP